ncbi:hypothetical protein [Psychrobacillus vulpis]|uniref:Uncharacterized protein n=1 Tax=Psychrobacillus vulpis TaxID=2325572 RepID=A0A544TRQ8_9BACI|nr:hypothetical protein [Psychrobacillus vulpis]TQR20131.1 hypothetical protein FG384_09570 [Psychrobacillus vulpis]
MKKNAEKIIYIIVPLYLLLLIFGRGINTTLYSIFSFVLGITMLYLAFTLLRKQLQERKKS